MFDIENTSEKNWDIPFPDIAISYPSGNAYEPENFDLPSQVQIFVKRCGYVSASNAIELDAGAAPVRCIAAFLVSESDLAGSDPGMFSVGLNDGFGGSFELGAESIKEIALPDGIFEIEEDPDAYQLAMSLPARSNIASNLVSAAVNAFNSGDSDSCLLDLLSAQSFFFEDANWGVSVLMDGVLDTATVLSESLPAFNVEAIARIDEERGADAVTLRDCTTQMYDAFLQGDYATVNTAKDQAYTVFLKYQQL